MKWISSGRNHKLVDSDGNVLMEAEDRTCNGSYINENVLDQLRVEYLKEQKGRNDQQ